MGSAVLMFALILAAAPPRRIVVAPGGPVPTVAAALRLARAGDTVVVTAGIYREPRIEVRVPVTLLGAGDAVQDVVVGRASRDRGAIGGELGHRRQRTRLVRLTAALALLAATVLPGALAAPSQAAEDDPLSNILKILQEKQKTV